MLHRYRYLDEIVTAVQNEKDKATKLYILRTNKDNPGLKSLLQYIYDYRFNFEVSKLPELKPGRRDGWSFHSALKYLDTQLNDKLIDASKKSDVISNAMSQLSERDSNLLYTFLTNEIDLGLTVTDVQSVFKDILAPLNLAKKPASLTELSYPGYLIRVNDYPTVNIIVSSTGNNRNFKFVTDDGQALVLPDKLNSKFTPHLLSVFPARYNVVFECLFLAMKKDDINVSDSAAMKLFNKFKTGTAEKDSFGLRILDSVDLLTYQQAAYSSPYNYEARQNWRTSQNFESESFKMAQTIKVDSIEAMRKLEDTIATSDDKWRFYGVNDLWQSGYSVIDRTLF